MKELQINEQIREREVRLIGADGQQFGIISIQEARNIAEEQGYDLCKMSDSKKTDNGFVPATCKLMDYGKYRYEQQKREKEAKKNQKIVEIKEIRQKAFRAPFRLTAPEPIHRIAWLCGAGSLNSQGFGLLTTGKQEDAK